MSGHNAEIDAGLTPTEELVMEVLAARHRLGEQMWTFDARHKRAIESLADKGLVNPMHGIVERTVRASLTDKGVRESVSGRYAPPAMREIERLLNRALEAGDRFGRYSEQWADAIRDVRTRVTPPGRGSA